MKAAQGILTVRGGMTSHAAVVARGMGKCCVSGCGAIKMDEENKQLELSGKTFHEGDWLSIDGSTGKTYDGAIPTVDASIGGEFGRVTSHLLLAQGKAELAGSGSVLLNKANDWRFSGKLQHFDPAAFVDRLPRAELNADFAADGRVLPQLAGNLRFQSDKQPSDRPAAGRAGRSGRFPVLIRAMR